MIYPLVNDIIYQTGGVRNYLSKPYNSGGVFGEVFEYLSPNPLNLPPETWRCAYCSSLQSDVKDVIIRAHKIKERLNKCFICSAPRTERKV